MRQPVSGGNAFLVGLAGVSAVGLGAFGAHALRGVVDAAGMEIWHTAVLYHFWHALALLIAVACLADNKARRVAVISFAIGILLFSGSLYALALGAPRPVGIITPFGGVAFMAGWVATSVALRRAT